VQRFLAEAVRAVGIHEQASRHMLRRSSTTHLLEDGYDICTVQELLGHRDIKTTMYTYVLNRGVKGARSPLVTPKRFVAPLRHFGLHERASFAEVLHRLYPLKSESGLHTHSQCRLGSVGVGAATREATLRGRPNNDAVSRTRLLSGQDVTSGGLGQVAVAVVERIVDLTRRPQPVAHLGEPQQNLEAEGAFSHQPLQMGEDLDGLKGV
jgi:hypothetical protein